MGMNYGYAMYYSYVRQKPFELKAQTWLCPPEAIWAQRSKVAMSARSHTSSKDKGSYDRQKLYELKGSYVRQKPYELNGQR